MTLEQVDQRHARQFFRAQRFLRLRYRSHRLLQELRRLPVVYQRIFKIPGCEGAGAPIKAGARDQGFHIEHRIAETFLRAATAIVWFIGIEQNHIAALTGMPRAPAVEGLNTGQGNADRIGIVAMPLEGMFGEMSTHQGKPIARPWAELRPVGVECVRIGFHPMFQLSKTEALLPVQTVAIYSPGTCHVCPVDRSFQQVKPV